MDAKDARVIRNADNEYLEPWGSRGLIIGYVDEVNGDGAQEIPGFVVTRHELIELVKYWTKRAIDIQYFWFCHEQVGSTDMRVEPFARRRVTRIARLIGQDEAAEAIEQAYEEYAASFQDCRAFTVFCHGTAEERKALHDEFRKIGKEAHKKECSSPDCTCRDEHT